MIIKNTEDKKVSWVLSKLYSEFFNSEKSSGFILIGCTIISLLIANSGWGVQYNNLWSLNLGGLTAAHWINDGLMAIFFLLVGLEIERELYIGELSKIKYAMLPIMAALGGMMIPALIHYGINAGTATVNGYAIPMATDIAFALGILSLAGKNVPPALKIFLTALAIIDDLGAIIIIAIFYTEKVSFIYLIISLGIFIGLFIMGRMRVQHLVFYIIPGAFMWFFMYQSGVHATISGVLLAFAIPFGKGGDNSLSYKLQHFLHKPVAFFIVPLFALANTGIKLETELYNELLSKNSLGIIAGLVIGKPLGIILFTWLAVKTKLSQLPGFINWKHIIGVSLLAGIGFTMSIFIALLAFKDPSLIVNSKIAILCASLVAAISGLIILKSIKFHPSFQEDDQTPL